MKTTHTFAQRAKAIERKYPNHGTNKVEHESFMDEIKALAEEQEAFKAENGIQSPGQQMGEGGKMYNVNFPPLLFPDGGKTYPYGGKSYMSTDYAKGGPVDPPTETLPEVNLGTVNMSNPVDLGSVPIDTSYVNILNNYIRPTKTFGGIPYFVDPNTGEILGPAVDKPTIRGNINDTRNYTTVGEVPSERVATYGLQGDEVNLGTIPKVSTYDFTKTPAQNFFDLPSMPVVQTENTDPPVITLPVNEVTEASVPASTVTNSANNTQASQQATVVNTDPTSSGSPNTPMPTYSVLDDAAFLNALGLSDKQQAEGIPVSSTLSSNTGNTTQTSSKEVSGGFKLPGLKEIGNTLNTLAPSLLAMSTNLAMANNVQDPTLIRPQQVTPYINPNYFNIEPMRQAALDQSSSMAYRMSNQGVDAGTKARMLNQINQGTLQTLGQTALEGQKINMAEDQRIAASVNRANEINTANLNQAYLNLDQAQGEADALRRTYRQGAMASLMGGMEDLQFQRLANKGAPYLEAIATFNAYRNGRK